MQHYIEPYFRNPTHPISVIMIGCGGNGTAMLNQLARINASLLALDHVGIHVTVYDDDTVSPYNIGRQQFSPQDIGNNKATTLVTRLNRFYGWEWDGIPTKWNGSTANIMLTCVDNVSTRVDVSKLKTSSDYMDFGSLCYWIDMGNSQNTGQVILGSFKSVKQPKGKDNISKLPNVLEKFPDMAEMEDKEEPSCSMQEALAKQDLMINPMVANVAASIIWKLFQNVSIDHVGAYINSEKLNINPIKL
jgi:PRTRC genetic system ThiF family protein